MTVEESRTKYQRSMDAIIGNSYFTLFSITREVSHPNLIEITKIPSKADPECSNIANVKAISTKSSSSLIWISARDKRNIFLHKCYRFRPGPQMRGQAWKNIASWNTNSPKAVLPEWLWTSEHRCMKIWLITLGLWWTWQHLQWTWRTEIWMEYWQRHWQS